MNDLNTKEVSDICVSCGMCCDGTLFKMANLNTPDIQNINANVKKAVDLGMDVYMEKEKYYFRLPCHHFNKCCTVYDKIRPNVCGSFFCDPLKSAEKGEITFEKANSIIQKALNLKKEILLLASSFNEFDGMVWTKLLNTFDTIFEESNPEILKKYGIIIIKIAMFKNLMKEIYSPKKEAKSK